jgi:prepilin signal peptidase PulO-like enzyme (type II secretory pathway)
MGVVAAVMSVALAYPVSRAVATLLWPVKRLVAEPLGDRARFVLLEAIVVACVFTLGATLGSFLNVVVHRLPRGRSPLQGRSHCPACGHQIRARDNIPILGWLRLGGRCRDCGVLIAACYPIVEAVCGSIVLALFGWELLSGGATIPIRQPNRLPGMDSILLHPQSDLVGLFLFHAAVLLVLVVWTLVAADGGRLPRGHLLRVLTTVALLPVVWPPLHPVPVLPGAAEPAWLIQGLAVSVVGLAVGGLLGRLAGRSVALTWWPTACLALWGAACGWQAALGTALVCAVLAGTDRLLARHSVWLPLPLPWLLLAAAVIHLSAWRAIHLLFMPG